MPVTRYFRGSTPIGCEDGAVRRLDASRAEPGDLDRSRESMSKSGAARSEMLDSRTILVLVIWMFRGRTGAIWKR